MHIDSVGHHPFVQAILGDDRSLAGREMGSVRLCREIPRIVRPFQANGETIQRDILAHLRQEAHSLGIMNLDILQSRIHVMIQEDTGSRTFQERMAITVPGTKRLSFQRGDFISLGETSIKPRTPTGISLVLYTK